MKSIKTILFTILAASTIACDNAETTEVEFEVEIVSHFMASMDSEGVDAVLVTACGQTDWTIDIDANMTFVNGHGQHSGSNDTDCATTAIPMSQEIEIYGVDFTYTENGETLSGSAQKIMELIN